MFVCGWVRVRVHASKHELKCAHVCQCALGLYNCGNNKSEWSDMQAIWREYPIRSLNLVPVAAYNA